MAPIDLLLERLDAAGVELHERGADGNGGRRWRGGCPLCGKDDRLSVWEQDLNGDAGLSCFAHCEKDALLELLGLTWRDLCSPKPASATGWKGRLRAGTMQLLGHRPKPYQVEPGLPFLATGKASSMAAETKSGKSLTVLLGAIDAALAGRRVVILDRENGTDEYAGRFHSIIAGRGLSPEQRATVSEHLSYVPFPEVPFDGDEDAFEFLREHDVAVFDSARTFLAPMGLAEDSSDDYATFMNVMIEPLRAAGVTVCVLDNVGHENKTRARGASGKRDLVDVALVMKQVEPFSELTRGRIEVSIDVSRLGRHVGPWTVELGGGHYGEIVGGHGEPVKAKMPFRPTLLMERMSRAIERTPGMTTRAVREAVDGKNDTKDAARRLLIEEGFVEVEAKGQTLLHRSVRPYRTDEDSSTVPPMPAPCPDRAPTVPLAQNGHREHADQNRAPEITPPKGGCLPCPCRSGHG